MPIEKNKEKILLIYLILVGEVMYTEVFERDGKSLGCG